MRLNYAVMKKIEHDIGDSWYIFDKQRFAENYNSFLGCFQKIYLRSMIAYSYKTNYLPELCKTVDGLGGYGEVVSEMEYDLAIKVGVDPKRIIVNGPYKPITALKKFLFNQSTVNLDSYNESGSVLSIAKSHPNTHFHVGLRCNFPFKGEDTSRFGFDVDSPKFLSLVQKLSQEKNIEIECLHCHYPHRSLESFAHRAEKMIEIYDKVSRYCSPRFIDVGGSFGGRISEDLSKYIGIKEIGYENYAKVVAGKFKERFENVEDAPILVLEPGTALVADVMSYVYKVIDIKNIRGKNIAMTTGSKVNYQSRTTSLILPIKVYSEKNGDAYNPVDISGYTCMANDYLYENYQGELRVGDFIVVDNVGAYSIVFKPPFINPNVPIVIFDGAEVSVIKKAESFEQIFETYVI